ncbi:spike base protein, RCAP_Rcc01079 family [Blastochloris tepida]|uniref:Uncharacterized protein n=1 Tax=Blastochloris tepida TaxID=2233851 RepID=A0A348G1F7_9HYPH|nr:hypothetical protein [Blastochloris tepida]BBF93390.1 hypothetical protein BLTE_20750 [Blastochloris tepida]
MPYDKGRDPFAQWASARSAPALRLVDITPTDAELPIYPKALRIVVGTDVALTNGFATVRVVPISEDSDTATVDLKVPQGLTIEPTGVRRVLATGTTAGVVVQGYVT